MRRKKKLQSADEEDERDDPAEDLADPAVRHLAGVLDAGLLEVLDQLGVLDADRGERTRPFAAVLERAADASSATATSWTLPSRTSCLNVAVGDRLAALHARRRRPGRAPAAGSTPSTYHIAEPGPVRGGSLPVAGASARAGLGVCPPCVDLIRLIRPRSVMPTDASGVDRLLDLGELELAARRVDPDDRALAELSLQHAHRQRVEHPPLDRSASAAARRRSGS